MTDPLATDLLGFIRAEIAMTDDPVEVDTDLLMGGFVDSLGVVRITHWLEDRLGFPVPAGDITLENFRSVSAIAAYVERTEQPSTSA